LPFKFNVYRYTEGVSAPEDFQLEVGRCKLNYVDPQLESDWFQTRTLE
jgi:hypothetical protein